MGMLAPLLFWMRWNTQFTRARALNQSPTRTSSVTPDPYQVGRARLLLLEGPLADAEPKTLRYRLLHTAARIIKRARKQILRIPETWPWATELETAFGRALAIP